MTKFEKIAAYREFADIRKNFPSISRDEKIFRITKSMINEGIGSERACQIARYITR